MYLNENNFSKKNIPTTLNEVYKFRKINDNSFDILKTNKIYLASPTEFNDIFDSKKQIDFSFFGKSIAEHLYHEFRDDPQYRHLDRKQLRKMTRKDSKKYKLGYEKKELAKLQELRESTGIISFSSEKYSQLLWAHYAEDHKGFCIVFDVEKLIKSCEYIEKGTGQYICPLQKVNYVPSLEPLYFWKEEVYKTWYRYFYEKTKEWEYEREYRLTRPGDAKIFLELEPNTITGLIFGSRTEQSSINKINDIITGRNIKLYKCVINSNGKFEIISF